jgi:hypothetical protein
MLALIVATDIALLVVKLYFLWIWPGKLRLMTTATEEHAKAMVREGIDKLEKEISKEA